MDNLSKKELQAQYREREIIGGVYVIQNTLQNKLLMDIDVNLRSSRNRFNFAVMTGSCVHPKLRTDWVEQKGQHFIFKTLEEIKKQESQSISEFKGELELLQQMWLEKLAGETFY
ncbi:MAG: GIY-YIG nuclease family protein [Oscillospiraceae bacterium]|nr:GIY-YIG nuclease family protein [Oscillospiraceae bacterium]